MVRVTDRVWPQPSSNPAQRSSNPSPDHSPSSSDDGSALPDDGAAVGCGSAFRSSAPTRYVATMMAISPASAVGTPTTTHRGGRPEGPPGGPAGGGRPAGLGGVPDLPPYGPVTCSPPAARFSGQDSSLIALANPRPRGCWMAMWRKPACSSCCARRSGPTSMGRSPPSAASRETACFAASSSPAMSTSSGWPSTSPATSVGANVVLNALTTWVPSGTSCCTSSAEELPGAVANASQVATSTGLVMSTTTLPANWSPYRVTASLIPG